MLVVTLPLSATPVVFSIRIGNNDLPMTSGQELTACHSVCHVVQKRK